MRRGETERGASWSRSQVVWQQVVKGRVAEYDSASEGVFCISLGDNDESRTVLEDGQGSRTEAGREQASAEASTGAGGGQGQASAGRRRHGPGAGTPGGRLRAAPGHAGGLGPGAHSSRWEVVLEMPGWCWWRKGFLLRAVGARQRLPDAAWTTAAGGPGSCWPALPERAGLSLARLASHQTLGRPAAKHKSVASGSELSARGSQSHRPPPPRPTAMPCHHHALLPAPQMSCSASTWHCRVASPNSPFVFQKASPPPQRPGTARGGLSHAAAPGPPPPPPPPLPSRL